MNHLIAAPLLLPPLVGAIMITSMRHHLELARVFSVASIVALLGIAIGLLAESGTGVIQNYLLGNWPAPFGIVLVLDRLSALMVTLTALLALPIVLYAIGSDWDRRGRHFHALLQFQLMGIFGAFLTGDIFNLFVFFEILLIASYGLMIHGAGKRRLQAGVQYVVFNLLGSTLFLFALGTIYGVTGTLNMADLSIRVAEMPETGTALIRVAAVLLLLVFAVKAALLPLHFWLPASYAEAPAPVAALFAVMTKVGAYAILRIFTLIFGPSVAVTQGLIGPWLILAAMATLAMGVTGVLGARSLGRLAAFSAISSMGTLLIAVALFTPQGTTAALYYMIHSTLAGAALFLVVDLVRTRRASGDDSLVPAPPMAQGGLVAALFFVAAIGMAGMPPLSGFVGKLLVMTSARGHDLDWLIWTVILATTLVAMVGFVRAGSVMFWKTTEATATRADDPPARYLALTATCALMGLLAVLMVSAGPVSQFLDATAAQLHDPAAYHGSFLPPSVGQAQ